MALIIKTNTNSVIGFISSLKMDLLGPLLTTSFWAHFACMFCGKELCRSWGPTIWRNDRGIVEKCRHEGVDVCLIWKHLEHHWFFWHQMRQTHSIIASGSAGRNSFSWQAWLQIGTCVAEVSWYDEAFSSRSSWPNCAVWVIDVQEIYKRNKTTTRLTNLKLSTLISWPWWWQLPRTNAAWRPKKSGILMDYGRWEGAGAPG